MTLVDIFTGENFVLDQIFEVSVRLMDSGSRESNVLKHFLFRRFMYQMLV